MTGLFTAATAIATGTSYTSCYTRAGVIPALPVSGKKYASAGAEGLDSMLDCTHHWILGSPINNLVHAKCKKCGEEKDFPAIPTFFTTRAKGAPSLLIKKVVRANEAASQN